MSRVTFIEKDGKSVLIIKAHNSFIYGFAAAFFLNFFAGLFIILMMIVETAIYQINLDLHIIQIGRVILTVYEILMAGIILRSVIWTIGGKEVLEFSGETITYCKSIFGIGRKVSFSIEEVEYIKGVDYAETKDLSGGVKAELRKGGRSFLLKAGEKELHFGVFMLLSDLREAEKHIDRIIKVK